MRISSESEVQKDSANQCNYNCQRKGGFPRIQMQSNIKMDELASDEHMLKSHYLTLVIYNYLQTPKMEEFLGMHIEAEGQLTLVRKPLNDPNITKINQNHQQDSNIIAHSLIETSNLQQDTQYQYYLLYMINDNIPLQHQDEKNLIQQHHRQSSTSYINNNRHPPLKPVISLLISLSDKVIVYELDKQKQSFIEKVFIEAINTSQKIKWQFKSQINRPNRLVFIKQCYSDRKQTKFKLNPDKKFSIDEMNDQVKENQPFQGKGKNQKEKDKLSKQKQRQRQRSKQRTNQAKNEQQAKTLTASTSLQTLQYYSCLQQYAKYLEGQIKKYMELCIYYPQRPDHPYVEQLIVKQKCLKMISLSEIIGIYEQVVKFMDQNKDYNNRKRQAGKGGKYAVGEIFVKNRKLSGTINEEIFQLQEPWKIRYYIQKVYELQSITSLYNTIEYELFHPNSHTHTPDFIRKQLRKYLTSTSHHTSSLLFSQYSFVNLEYLPPFSRQITLSYEAKQKLLWKLNRIEKYQQQLAQEHKISPQISQNKLLYELKDEEISNWIGKYKNWWMEHSMKHLKQFFNKIANEKDHKAIQQFKQECYKMTQKINKLDIKLNNSSRQTLIKEIKLEINAFVDYHFEVLETRGLAGIKFLYHEIKYTLKHKEKARNKLLLFALMVILALMQKNVIAGITIITMAIIVLAIRI